MRKSKKKERREQEEKSYRSFSVGIIAAGLGLTQKSKIRQFWLNKEGWHAVIHVGEKYLLQFLQIIAQTNSVKIITVNDDNSELVLSEPDTSSPVTHKSSEMLARARLKKAIDRAFKEYKTPFQSRMTKDGIVEYRLRENIGLVLLKALHYAPMSISIKRQIS